MKKHLRDIQYKIDNWSQTIDIDDAIGMRDESDMLMLAMPEAVRATYFDKFMELRDRGREMANRLDQIWKVNGITKIIYPSDEWFGESSTSLYTIPSFPLLYFFKV